MYIVYIYIYMYIHIHIHTLVIIMPAGSCLRAAAWETALGLARTARAAGLEAIGRAEELFSFF